MTASRRNRGLLAGKAPRNASRSLPILLAGALALATTFPAWAHVDPPGSSGTGITGEMTAFRNDGVTPVLPGTVSPCETILYRATVRYAGGINGAFEGGTINIVTPDGTSNNVNPVGGVPCVGGTINDPNSAMNGGRGLCAGAPTFINSQTVTYVVDPTDAVMNTITANLNYISAFAHISGTDQFGVGAMTPLPITIEPCPDSTDCVDSFCDANLVVGPRKGVCVTGNVENSTPCDEVPDVPGDCRTPGCEAGVCVATHINEPNSTVCTTTPDIPGDCGTPGCEAGACVATHVPVPNSTACTTTPDIPGDCRTPGCEAGVCVATHINEPNSTVCSTTPDIPGDCGTPGCEAGACVATHLNVPDSTACTTTPDIPGDCRTPGCEAGVCIATHINEPNSTVCTTTPDITGDCGTPGCEAGVCVATHNNAPDSTPCTTTPDVPGDCATPGCEAGACVATHVPQPNDIPCTDADNDDCTTALCEGGVCDQDAETVVCPDDGDPCTTERCDPETGMCVSNGSGTSGIAFLVRSRGQFGNLSQIFAGVGANDPGGILRFGKKTFAADGTKLVSDLMNLGDQANVFDVITNQLHVGKGVVIRGSSNQNPVLPLTNPFCPIPDFDCGVVPLTVPSGATEGPIAPESRGAVTVLNGATLILAPGTHNFCSLRAGYYANIVVNGPGQTTINVVGDFRLRNGTSLLPAPGAPTPIINIAGLSVRISAASQIEAILSAPDALLSMGRNARLRGTFCVDRAKSDKRIILECPLPPASPNAAFVEVIQ